MSDKKVIFNGDKLNISYLNELVKKPILFSTGEKKFWNDPYISQSMLDAHLDPEVDAASRKHATIKKTCEWIVSEINVKPGMKLIDLGCGPGLYCQELFQYNLNITGIDYSRRSIEYARKITRKKKLSINYIYQNYLTLDYDNQFDIALLIYYDFGTFSSVDRRRLLKVINEMLKAGGYFVFDVLTPGFTDAKEEKQSWSVNEGGFWKPCILLIAK